MQGVKSVEKDGKTYAYFFKGNVERPGVSFLTPQESSFQIGVQEQPPGFASRPHLHPPAKFDVQNTGEFIYLEKGKVKAIVYDEEFNEIGQESLEEGDFLVFLHGGHKIEVIEDCKFVEVKQGPYPGDEKAKIFHQKL